MTTISGSDEIYRKLSSQIEAQFPEHLREDGPKFVAFLKAYFEYLEQSQKAGDASRGLIDYLDIDRTLDDFVEYFKREFLINIPESILADERLLIKHIRNFYNSRGSQASLRFLFRALFDQEIDLYYPGEDILRTSDGRWVKETIIRGFTNTGNPDNLDGHEINGSLSGASARVQEIVRIEASGLTLIQLIVENVLNGSFIENDIVSDGFGNSIKIFNAVGSLENVSITDGGAFHQSGDVVSLLGSGGGVATGVISATTDTSAITIKINNGGSGYRKDGNTVLTISGGSPRIPARARVLNLSNTTTLNINTDTINAVKDVVLLHGGAPHTFGSGAAAFAAANMTSTLTSALAFGVTVGSINTIALLVAGSGYTGSLPTITAVDAEVAGAALTDSNKGGIKGQNAVLVAQKAYGSIANLSITTSDINFLKNDNITLTNLTRSYANTTDLNTDLIVNPSMSRGLRRQGVYNATVTASIEGSFDLAGRYTDTKGFLSWNNKLRDQDYYQEFSYVIRAHKLLNDYKNVVQKLVHPAGTKMFGSVMADSGVDMNSTFDTGSAVATYKRLHTNNVIVITGASPKSVRLSKPPNWLNNGTLKANTGAISVGGAGSNLIFVSVSNTAVANGLFQINAISSSSQLTIRNAWENGLLSNGYFYYNTNYKGSI